MTAWATRSIGWELEPFRLPEDSRLEAEVCDVATPSSATRTWIFQRDRIQTAWLEEGQSMVRIQLPVSRCSFYSVSWSRTSRVFPAASLAVCSIAIPKSDFLPRPQIKSNIRRHGLSEPQRFANAALCRPPRGDIQVCKDRYDVRPSGGFLHLFAT